jgi:hypothetical protein
VHVKFISIVIPTINALIVLMQIPHQPMSIQHQEIVLHLIVLLDVLQINGVKLNGLQLKLLDLLQLVAQIVMQEHLHLI